jgi:hypothetical protein
MMASTVGPRRPDPATLREEEVRPDAAPLLDHAFPRLLVIRQVPKLCPERKGGDPLMPDLVGLLLQGPSPPVLESHYC